MQSMLCHSHKSAITFISSFTMPEITSLNNLRKNESTFLNVLVYMLFSMILAIHFPLKASLIPLIIIKGKNLNESKGNI